MAERRDERLSTASLAATPRFVSPRRGRAFVGSPLPRRPTSPPGSSAQSDADGSQAYSFRAVSPRSSLFPLRAGSPLGSRSAAVEEITSQRRAGAAQSADLQARICGCARALHCLALPRLPAAACLHARLR
jgi:hypothetical protein